MTTLTRPTFRRVFINDLEPGLVVSHAYNGYDSMGLRFSDGSVFFAEATPSYGGCASLEDSDDIPDYVLVEFGLWTEGEMEAFQTQEAIKHREQVEANKRAEYERLKQIYGDK